MSTNVVIVGEWPYFCDVFRMNDGNWERKWKTKTLQFLTISVKQSPQRLFLILRTTFFLVWRKLLHQCSGYTLCDWRQNICNKYLQVQNWTLLFLRDNLTKFPFSQPFSSKHMHSCKFALFASRHLKILKLHCVSSFASCSLTFDILTGYS